jgi:hypothetical protein
MGDVDGNWSPAGANRPALLRDNPNAIQASLANVDTQPGSTIEVPLSISNLNGAGVDAYQFDIEYDPAVVEPAQVAADLTGTISSSLAVAFNVPTPGLLKVVVYGAIPATGDGTYINLRFNTIGAAGSSSPLSISEFIINSGTEAVSVTNGQVTVSGASGNSSTLTGRLLSATGRPVPSGSVTLVASNRDATQTVVADTKGRFQFQSLTVGETYTVTVRSKGYRFTPATVSVTAGATAMDLIAEPADVRDEM